MYKHLARNFAAAAVILGLSLALGAIGYHGLEGMGWLDAFYCAAMILTGMGPTGPLVHPSAKVFAILYSVFSAVLFLLIMALVLAPVLRRFLHRFHLESEEEEEAALQDPRDAAGSSRTR